jgi:hypothetical protein
MVDGITETFEQNRHVSDRPFRRKIVATTVSPLSVPKIVRKTLNFTVLRLLFDFLSLKMMYKYLQKVICRKTFF